uniref:Uncharacterized protein n=2 Tax=unclassified Mycobacterium TaxID=2642494 RepID=A0A5Q5BKM2_MYCSS
MFVRLCNRHKPIPDTIGMALRGVRAGRAERRRSRPVPNTQETAHLHEYPPDRPVTARGILSLATDSRAATVGLAARCGCVGRFGANPRGPPIGGRIFSSGSQVAPASAILRAAEGKSGIPELTIAAKAPAAACDPIGQQPPRRSAEIAGPRRAAHRGRS